MVWCVGGGRGVIQNGAPSAGLLYKCSSSCSVSEQQSILNVMSSHSRANGRISKEYSFTTKKGVRNSGHPEH